MISRRTFMKVSSGAVNVQGICRELHVMALLSFRSEGPWLRV